MDLHQRVMIVTGGAQGIGRGVSAHFLERGWRVVMADIDVEAGAECVADYAEYGDNLLFFGTDVANEGSVIDCIAECVIQFGRIDALVNNAGIADPHGAPVSQLPLSVWNRILSTNLTGCFLMAKHAVPHLRGGGGSIINIASTRAIQSEADTEAYAASKGGIVALTHALAVSLGPMIRVNCISPGWIETGPWKKNENRQEAHLSDEDHRQHPAGRVGRPSDIAALIDYLVSDGAGFVTGQNFIIDGGMTRKMIYWQ